MASQAAAAQLGQYLFGGDFAKTGQLGGLIGGLGSLFGGGAPGGVTQSGDLAAALNSIDFRAGGGPVRAGMPYIVGERGPELIVPKAAGTVLPNGTQLGAPAPTYQVIVQGDASANTIRLINNALAQFQARQVRAA